MREMSCVEPFSTEYLASFRADDIDELLFVCGGVGFNFLNAEFPLLLFPQQNVIDQVASAPFYCPQKIFRPQSSTWRR